MGKVLYRSDASNAFFVHIVCDGIYTAPLSQSPRHSVRHHISVGIHRAHKLHLAALHVVHGASNLNLARVNHVAQSGTALANSQHDIANVDASHAIHKRLITSVTVLHGRRLHVHGFADWLHQIWKVG